MVNMYVFFIREVMTLTKTVMPDHLVPFLLTYNNIEEHVKHTQEPKKM